MYLILISLALWLMSIIPGAIRWRLILLDSRVEYPLHMSYLGYLIGTFYSSFLPGAVSGDAIRIGLCISQTKCEFGTATLSVLLERVTGVLALLTLLLGVTSFFPQTWSPLLPDETRLIITRLSGICISLIIVLIWLRRAWLKWIPEGNYSGIRGFFYSGLRSLGNSSGRTLGSIYLLSVGLQTTRIAGILILSIAIGISVNPIIYFGIIPIVYFATLIPISLGGLGIREGTLVYMLSQYSVDPSAAVMLSFLAYLIQVSVGIIGGVIQIIWAVSSDDPNNDHITAGISKT
jgi:uncharacterized protein (TIRG00374 family)